MLSAIQIKQHVFTHIEVVCDPDCLKAPENESYEVTLSATEPTKETDDAPWKMNVDVRFGSSDKAQPVRYRGHLTVIGFFDVHASFAEDKRLDLVRMNGGSLLIGSIREMVLTLTSRSARGPFELPTFDVRMFLKQPEATKADDS